MKRPPFAPIVMALALSACNGSSSSPAAAPLALGGQYTGTASDSVLGSATATGSLTESGSTLSGTVVLTSTTSSSTLSQAVSLAIGASYAASGTFTVAASGGSCTFAATGAYNTSTNTLAGTYTATSGCTGETGSFTLVQQCETTSSERRRTLTRPTAC